MTSLLAPVVFVFAFVFVFAPASSAPGQQMRQVRALDARAGEALARGLERSAVFRQLAHELERSDLIVHIVAAVGLPRGIGGMTRIASGSGGYRYVRITLESSLAPDLRAAVLGHELQHACEIARSPAETVAGLRRLYQQIGRPVPGAGEAFDTPAADAAGRRVWRELAEGAWHRNVANDAVPADASDEKRRGGGSETAANPAIRCQAPPRTTRDRALCAARSGLPGTQLPRR